MFAKFVVNKEALEKSAIKISKRHFSKKIIKQPTNKQQKRTVFRHFQMWNYELFDKNTNYMNYLTKTYWLQFEKNNCARQNKTKQDQTRLDRTCKNIKQAIPNKNTYNKK